MNEIEPVTPGPWETSEGPHRKSDMLGRPEKWRYVQHNFPSAPYEGELSDEWGIYPPLGEAGPVALVAGESNAKLIASAPDLLAALEYVRRNELISDRGVDVIDAALKRQVHPTRGHRPMARWYFDLYLNPHYSGWVKWWCSCYLICDCKAMAQSTKGARNE